MKFNWENFKKEFAKTGYLTFDPEIETKFLKSIRLSEDEKETLKFKQFNTLNYPLERQNPDILMMILDINSRLQAIENDLLQRIEKLERECVQLKEIFICDKETEPKHIEGNGTIKDLEVIYKNGNKEKEMLGKLEVISYEEV